MAKYLFKINDSNAAKKPLTARINCSKSMIKTLSQDVKYV